MQTITLGQLAEHVGGKVIGDPNMQIEALRDYREAMGIAARLVVVGMVSNGFTVADPNDAGMLDVVGFDAAAPGLIADFARGEV